jgi:hypothetical protein
MPEASASKVNMRSIGVGPSIGSRPRCSQKAVGGRAEDCDVPPDWTLGGAAADPFFRVVVRSLGARNRAAAATHDEGRRCGSNLAMPSNFELRRFESCGNGAKAAPQATGGRHNRMTSDELFRSKNPCSKPRNWVVVSLQPNIAAMSERCFVAFRAPLPYRSLG